tara:strand:+ start:883 stop:1305 length:423 start_codon:yes stop_codon:yes gene_type:complete
MDIDINKNRDTLLKINNAFKMFSDPIDMMAYLIDIGKKSHNISHEEKIDENIIVGCTSKAWMIISKIDNDRYCIATDSDSHIVSGLLYLLSLSVNNQSRDFINGIDAIKILNNIGLSGQITSQRTNGFLSAVQMLKKRIN